MSEQRHQWNQPATGKSRQSEEAVYERVPTFGWSSSTSRPARPDPCWETDEQIGSWSRCVRALEEGLD